MVTPRPSPSWKSLPVALLVASLGACAQTQSAVGSADSRAPIDVVVGDVASTAEAGADAGVDAATDAGADLGPAVDVRLPSCVWTALPAHAIGVVGHAAPVVSSRVLDDRLWVGYADRPPGETASIVRRVQVTDAAGLPLGPPVTLLSSPVESSFGQTVDLSTDPVTRRHGAVMWSGTTGCVALALDDGANPVGEPVRLSDRVCRHGARVREGWSYFTSDSGSVYPVHHLADAAGRELASRALSPERAARTIARERLPNGTIRYVWDDDHGHRRFTFSHVDARGVPIEPDRIVEVMRPCSVAEFLQVVEVGDSYVLAWVEQYCDARPTTAVAMRLARDGAVMVAPRVLGTIARSSRYMLPFALAFHEGAPVLVWDPDLTAMGPGTLRLTELDPVTLSPVATVDAATTAAPRELSLRSTSRGLVAVYASVDSDRSPPTRLWTQAFRCVPR